MPKQDQRLLFAGASNEAIDFLARLLTYDPRKRLTAKEVRSLSPSPFIASLIFIYWKALHHPFFHTSPAPTHPSKLPKPKGELVPRALPPDEGERGVTKKRKGALLEGVEEEAGSRKVARKLDFNP